MQLEMEPIREQILEHDPELFFSCAGRNLRHQVDALPIERRFACDLEILDVRMPHRSDREGSRRRTGIARDLCCPDRRSSRARSSDRIP